VFLGVCVCVCVCMCLCVCVCVCVFSREFCRQLPLAFVCGCFVWILKTHTCVCTYKIYTQVHAYKYHHLSLNMRKLDAYENMVLFEGCLHVQADIHACIHTDSYRIHAYMNMLEKDSLILDACAQCKYLTNTRTHE
jgi:hypothetical protein